MLVVDMKISFTFTAAPARTPECRSQTHSRRCPVPWGWDRDHTDQDRPYTLEQLIEREEGPHFYAYPDAATYKEGWYLWRALRRDGRLNPKEEAVRFAVLVERLNERNGAPHISLNVAELFGIPAGDPDVEQA